MKKINAGNADTFHRVNMRMKPTITSMTLLFGFTIMQRHFPCY